MADRAGRNRSRYAKDDVAERAAALALKLGVTLILHANGAVEITGRLDSARPGALASGVEGEADDYEAWKRGQGGAAGR